MPERSGRSAPRKHRRSLRMAVLLLLVIGTLAALLGYDLHESYDREFAINRQDAANLGDAIERQIRTTVEKIDVVLGEAVHDYAPGMASGPRPDVLSTNRDLLRREAAIPEAQPESLRIINAEGKVVFSAGNTERLPDVSVADRAYFLQQKDDPHAGLVMSEPILSRFTGKWLFTVSRRLSRPDGSFAGLVQTAIRADYFESGFQSIDVGGNGNVSLFSLVRSDLRLMARRPSVPDQIGKPFNVEQITGSLAAGRVKGVYQTASRADGVVRQYSFRKFEGLPLVVSIGVSRDDLLKGWTRKAWLYAASLLALSFELFCLIAYQRRTARRNQVVLERKVGERTAELSEANEKLRAAMLAAEAANIAKSQFLATMSHELRTPLNGILGMAQMLELDISDEAERKAFAGVIVNSGQTLLTMVNGILDLSRIESGEVELKLCPMCPLELVAAELALFSQAARDKNLRIESHGDAASQLLYLSDPVRLKQMLGKLLENALKFTEAGFVRAECRVIGTDAGEAILEFSVSDSGIGIPEEKRALLFQTFSQIDGSATRSYGGAGLGLSIVRKLAELMHGSVGVESECGKGSRFWFWVRAAIMDAPEQIHAQTGGETGPVGDGVPQLEKS